MKNLKRSGILLAAVLIIALAVMAGCGEDRSGNTINEPEITAEYLEGDFADQLITDGAETMLGSVDITKDGDTYNVSITEKAVISSSDYEEGYYIAETNIVKNATLGMDCRLTTLSDGKTEVTDKDSFIENNDKDRLYQVYFFGDSTELILAVDPGSVISK